MPGEASRDHWERIYRTTGERDVSWFEDVPKLSLDLISRTGAFRSSPILDVGGGLSHLADRLLAGGFSDVTVLDISEEAIRRVTEQCGGAVRGVVADITEWRPDRSYAVWHDRAVLHFLTSDEDRNAYRFALEKALAEDGQAVIFTFAPSGPEQCSGLPVRRYGRFELQAFLGEDFAMLESFEFDHATPGGSAQRFHAGRAARR